VERLLTRHGGHQVVVLSRVERSGREGCGGGAARRRNRGLKVKGK
jgi:hypothetical protein